MSFTWAVVVKVDVLWVSAACNPLKGVDFKLDRMQIVMMWCNVFRNDSPLNSYRSLHLCGVKMFLESCRSSTEKSDTR